jgi:aspartate aminotransferase-like enzyme
MGYNSTAQNVLGILYALETELARHGFRAEPGVGVAAAARSLNAG